jgi:hypothetical protein
MNTTITCSLHASCMQLSRLFSSVMQSITGATYSQQQRGAVGHGSVVTCAALHAGIVCLCLSPLSATSPPAAAASSAALK